MLVDDMSRNRCFFHVRISHVLRFISIYDLLIDSPSYHPVQKEHMQMHVTKWIARFMNNIFIYQVVPNRSPNSAIILDSASYYSHETENYPALSWRKDKLQEWIISHWETFEKYVLKKHLMETITRFRDKYDNYKVEEIGGETSNTVLLMSP
jgi:hypothetical protein